MKSLKNLRSACAVLSVVAVFSLIASNASAQGLPTVEEARAISQKTGRPILAIASSPTCGACQALLGELKSQPLVSRYVPLKVDATNGKEYSAWISKYPVEGSGIPKVFVIRADGKALFAQTGGMSGAKLSNFLKSHLMNSGTILDEKSLAKISNVSSKMAAALEEDDLNTIAVELPRLAAAFKRGGMNCFAKPAVDAKDLLAKLMERGTADIEKLKTRLTEDPRNWETLKDLAKTKRVFVSIPSLKKPLAEVLAIPRKDKKAKGLLAIATKFDRVNTIISKRKDGTKAAITELKKFAKKHPGTPIAVDANAWIARLKSETTKITKSL